MSCKYLWFILFLGMVYILYSHNYIKEIKVFMYDGLRALDIFYTQMNKLLGPQEQTLVKEKIFSVDELKQYTDLKTGLYLSILGQVYDVTKGVKHYGPGATYHAFTGRDASLAFITGQFNEEDLTDDISALSLDEIKSLHDWLEFYNKNYIYKGKLNGRYYNNDGTPTAISLSVKEKLVHAKNEKLMEEEQRKMFPPCNVEWKADAGSVVWCSKKSGGFERDWVGVPRKLFESPSSNQYRCACVKLDSQICKEAKGIIKEYSGCAETSTKCIIKLTDM